MVLDEKKKQQFAEWLEGLLKRQCIDGFKCSVCNSDDWYVLDEIIYLTGGTISYPNVGLICQCCKQTITFNATDSGVMDEDLDPSAIVCQECFKVEATMQKDDGEYLCSECYNK